MNGYHIGNTVEDTRTRERGVFNGFHQNAGHRFAWVRIAGRNRIVPASAIRRVKKRRLL